MNDFLIDLRKGTEDASLRRNIPWRVAVMLDARCLMLLSGFLICTGNVHALPTTSVTIAGSLQSELGCPGDWQPDCAASRLNYDAQDDVWQQTFTVPAGSWEYKVALNDSWDENYGAGAVQDGPNIPLGLAAETGVKFYFDDKTNWVTDNVNSRIVTAAGSFQSELGCAGDWDPSCLRSWLQDSDGDGFYRFMTDGIPVGTYDAKAAINESWDENYGAGGTRDGDNIQFSVLNAHTWVTFTFESATNILMISTEVQSVPAPTPFILLGLGLIGIGVARSTQLHRPPR